MCERLERTREFLAGVPEWCVSIGLCEDGVAVAGAVYSPSRDELDLGALTLGVTLNGEPVRASERRNAGGSDRPGQPPGAAGTPGPAVRRPALRGGPVGPLAYALALPAAGPADAMWSRSAKAEWNVAAGAALVVVAGGGRLGVPMTERLG